MPDITPVHGDDFVTIKSTLADTADVIGYNIAPGETITVSELEWTKRINAYGDPSNDAGITVTYLTDFDSAVGDLATLTTSAKGTVVAAINELNAQDKITKQAALTITPVDLTSAQAGTTFASLAAATTAFNALQADVASQKTHVDATFAAIEALLVAAGVN